MEVTPVDTDTDSIDPLAMLKRPQRVDEATEQLRQLKKLVAAGTVSLKIDQKRLTHMDSPVACDPDSTRWLYGLAVISALVWWRGGTTYGLVAIAVSAVIYATVARTFVKRRLERRVQEIALSDPTIWRKLWRFGGVALVAKDRGPAAPCTAPKDNWVTFVQQAADPGAGNRQSA
jgi:hypothetical protein